MFGSAILDLAIGLIFTFLAVSLAASAITETIASMTKWRSRTLRQGMTDLLNDRYLSGLALHVYNHALVNPRSSGTAQAQARPAIDKLPAYIDPKNFAHALMDVVGISGAAMTSAAIKLRIANAVHGNPQLRELLEGIVDRTANTAADLHDLVARIDTVEMTQELRRILFAVLARTQGEQDDPDRPTPDQIRQQIDQLPNDHNTLVPVLTALVDRTANIIGALTNPALLKQRVDGAIQDEQMKKLLNGIIDHTAGRAEQIADEIGRWFDSAMDRVSGAYKRWSQLISFIVALILVALLNVSAIHVTERLWRQPIDTATITKVKAEDIKDKDAASQILDKLYSVSALSSTVGWKDADTFQKFWTFEIWHPMFDTWTRLLGWIITAFATLFGAAFWFDALQQVIRLKGAGPSPAEKRQDKSAAA